MNSAHDSYTPLAGISCLGGMMLQCVFGGKGVGFLNALIYGLIAVFVAGLMVGRTPEFLGKKIEKQEIILVSLALLIHPLSFSLRRLVGGGSLCTVLARQQRYPWLLRVLYAFSRGGEQRFGFCRLNANTPWFNLATPPSSSSAAIRHHFPDGGRRFGREQTDHAGDDGTLRTDTVSFGVFWFATILIVGALTFFPRFSGTVADSSR